MNSLLQLTVYDKRQGKVKDVKYVPKPPPASENKLKAKSKSLNRSDRVNKVTRDDKLKRTTEKSRENLATLDNSQFGSLISLTKDVKKERKQSIEQGVVKTKESDTVTAQVRNKQNIEPGIVKSKESDTVTAQVRTKPTKNVVAPPIKTENNINGFYYTGSIELKFEEALEVCSDNLYDEIDEEFGRNLFDDESDNYILEAYNKPGDELVETYIQVEHRTRTLPRNDEKPKSKIKEKSVKDRSESKSLCLISDDEDCTFMEAYNSMGYELRKTYGLIDKSWSNTTIDKDFQNRTLSITSDVQEYFNDIEEKCESEDLRQPCPNTYMKYSRIIDEYRNSLQTANLKRMYDVKEGTAESKRAVRDVELPQPNDATCANYSKMVDEYKHSKQAAKLKKSTDGDSEDTRSTSSDEQSYNVSASPVAVKLVPQTKSDHIIHELLETELVYIKNLRKILTDYFKYFKKFPPLMQANVDVIFGNIKEIYKGTIEFYNALSMCLNDYEAIALTFVDYKDLFKLYPIYMKNKPNADRILLDNFKAVIEDRQRKLKDRLDLMSYLLNPIQRLGRYILLLENLQKSVRRSGTLDPAIDILKENMTKGNDAIAVESILRLPISLDLYRKGSYVDREKFMMIKPRRQEMVIFLFEEIVVFTVENITARRDVHSTFMYYSSIDMNDLSITIVDGEMQTFQLMDYPKCKRNKEDATYIFEAKDKKTRDNWGTLIQGRLWAQLEKFKGQSKSYKSVSRTNSTSSAKVHTTTLQTVSRESSTKSKKDSSNVSNGKKTEKADEKSRRRHKKPKSDAAARSSRFYTDPQNYKTM